MTSRRSLLLGPVATALATLLLTGCAMQSVGGSPAAQGSGQAPPAASGGSGSASPFDVCSFFSAAEVKQLVGSSPTGEAQTTPAGGSSCTWEDKDTYKSLTVEIGDPDTAINGTLPPWDPAFGPERTLPGGMRDINGAVQFVCAGTRQCSVQVVKEIQGDTDQKTGIGLVPKIRSKVGG